MISLANKMAFSGRLAFYVVYHLSVAPILQIRLRRCESRVRGRELADFSVES